MYTFFCINTITHEPCTQKGMCFSPNIAHIFFQTEDAFSIYSGHVNLTLGTECLCAKGIYKVFGYTLCSGPLDEQ